MQMQCRSILLYTSLRRPEGILVGIGICPMRLGINTIIIYPSQPDPKSLVGSSGMCFPWGRRQRLRLRNDRIDIQPSALET